MIQNLLRGTRIKGGQIRRWIRYACHCNGVPELAQVITVEWNRQSILAPLVSVGANTDYDVSAKVEGGGVAGQAIAVRHGIARCLLLVNEDFRKTLRRAGYLTRDPRAKERKKPGLKRARKAAQWAKR